MTERFPFIIYLAPIVLGTIGIILLASASSGEVIGYSIVSYKFLKQLIIFIMCIPLYIITSRITFKFWIKMRYIIIISVIIALISLKFFGITLNNSTRWFKIFNFTFEPTPFAHLRLIIFISGEKKLILSIIAISIISLLIFLQPDISSAFITILIGTIMIFTKGYRIPKIAYILFFSLIIPFFFPRQLNKFTKRTMSFYNDNIHNMTNYLKKGKMFGLGLGEGIDKFSSIPLPYSDNIFATGAQELGFLWGFIVISIFLTYYFYSVNYSLKSSFIEAKSLGFGVSSLIAIYALLNILSSLNIIPQTGDPLPFISHGGSSLVCFYLCAGIIGGITNESNNSWWRNRWTYHTWD